MTPVLGALFVVVTATNIYGDVADDHWPSWRGPNADGVAATGNPPLTWSETENIKWKIELPGSGDSTPIVWQDKMFVTTAVAMGEDLELCRELVLCHTEPVEV